MKRIIIAELRKSRYRTVRFRYKGIGVESHIRPKIQILRKMESRPNYMSISSPCSCSAIVRDACTCARLLLRRAAASLFLCPLWKLSNAALSLRAMPGLPVMPALAPAANERLVGIAPPARRPSPTELRVLPFARRTCGDLILEAAASSAARFSPSFAITLEREMRGLLRKELAEAAEEAAVSERLRRVEEVALVSGVLIDFTVVSPTLSSSWIGGTFSRASRTVASFVNCERVGEEKEKESKDVNSLRFSTRGELVVWGGSEGFGAPVDWGESMNRGLVTDLVGDDPTKPNLLDTPARGV